MTDYQKMYQEKLTTPDKIARQVQSGWLLGMDTATSQTPAIMTAIAEYIRSSDITGVKVQALLDAYPFEFYTDPTLAGKMTGYSWFSSSAARKAVNAGYADIIPAYYRDFPTRIRAEYDYDAVCVEVAPMDRHGYFSLALNGSYIDAMLDKTKRIFLEVNDRQPRGLCGSLIHISQVDAIVEYNHDLKAADKHISASIELEKAARKDLRPKLSGDANFQYTGNPIQLTLDLPSMQNPLTFEGKDMKYGASLTLLQPVYTGGRLLETIRMAKHQHSLAAHQAEYFRSALCYQTDMQYWNTVARAELLQVATDYRNSIASLTKTIRERVEAGLVDPQDLLMAEVKLNEAEYQLLQAKSSLETGRMALNSLIGTALHEITEVEDTIPSIVMNEQLWKQDGSNRPELKIAYDQIGIAESSKKLTDSKYKPQLYVGIEGSYSSPGYNFKSDLDPNYAVYAKLSVPIFEWGKRRNEKRAASFQIGAATDNLHQVSDHVNLEVQTARVSLSQAMEQVQLTRNSLEKARKNEQMALERYTEGKVSIVEMIEAQNYRQISQTNYVQAKVSAQGHYSALLKALNKY